jgi:hypothetical protein
VEEPIITEINFSELRFYMLIYPAGSLAQLKDIADKLSDKIEAIPVFLALML